MRYVSLFSGVEAATLAWGPLGWEAMAFCEVEPFPCAVLAHRYPYVPNLGDVREVDWRGFIADRGRPDVVVGGSPCQSFSIAGARTGLDGASGLMWEYVRAVRELRPRCLVWENVPGALSSTGGEDFRCLLAGLDELGYGLAWRVLDAQFFGVAQRRRRVFVVGMLGDPAGACEVLFERAGVPWDPAPGREKRKELAARAGRRAEAAGGALNAGDPQSKRVYDPDGPSPTLSSGTREGMSIQPSVLVGDAGGPAVMYVSGDCKATVSEQVSGTIPASSGGFKPGAVMCMTDTQPHSMVDPEICGALSSTMHKDPPVVAFAANQRGELRLQGGDGDVFGTLPCSWSTKQAMGVIENLVVRKLTPVECERLQGMPDDWTLVPYRGRPAAECPDGPRYKAVGNSMAVPVMRWIGERAGAALMLRGGTEGKR